MFTLRDSITIQAPIARCFALSTSIEIVHRELGMTAVAGRTAGLVQANDTVRWEGPQLGFHQVHVSLIDRFCAPTYFRDRMIEGRFRCFEHDHHLTETPEGTRLDDELRFAMPFGPPGWLVGQMILVPHIRGLMRRRFRLLKSIAESQEWRRYIPER